MKFIDSILKSSQNKRHLSIALCGTIIEFIIFKKGYPFPDFFSDSYSYIFAAEANLDISIWPIGYSKFLRWFHFLTYSDTALIAFQYFFFVLSSLYFYFTVQYHYKPKKINQIILFIFLFFNPLFLYICNYVNSDPIFLGLSILWFTELLWILHRPNIYHIIIQGILLFLCFAVRNNAYIYPFVTIVAFSLTKLRWQVKIGGAFLGLLLIIPFIIHTRNAAYKMTGTKQFSLFTGWQLANNALYMYEYVDTIKNLSPRCNELDKISKNFFIQVPTKFLHNHLLTDQGNFFIRASYAPLKQYFIRHYKIKDNYSGVVAWGQVSPLFKEYGIYLIKNNMRAYFWEFMLPNTRNYFIPYMEKLQVYNLGKSKIDPIAQYWFHYKTDDITSISKDLQGKILYAFPLIFLLINTYYFLNIFWLLYKVKNKSITYWFSRHQLLSAFFQISNFCFCIFSTIIVLRYQVFPLILCFTFSLLITEWGSKLGRSEEVDSTPQDFKIPSSLIKNTAF